MEKNKTAVEWLFEKLWDEPKDKFTWYAIREKAKQMENEQSFVHFKAGQDSMEEEGKSFDQYYSETFNK